MFPVLDFPDLGSLFGSHTQSTSGSSNSQTSSKEELSPEKQETYGTEGTDSLANGHHTPTDIFGHHLPNPNQMFGHHTDNHFPNVHVPTIDELLG